MKPMKYIPLRVHSVFSQGHGAIDPASLAQTLKQKQIPAMAFSDPFSLVGWEHFYHQAMSIRLKPLLGVEVKVRSLGSLILFPATTTGYGSLVATLNKKKLGSLPGVVAIFMPTGTVLSGLKLKERTAVDQLYIGLEWETDKQVVEEAARLGLPLVWAQPLKWLHNSDKYAVLSAVFQQQSLDETFTKAGGHTAVYGLMHPQAVIKRWGETGRLAMKNTFGLAEMIEFDFSATCFQRDAHRREIDKAAEKLERMVNRLLNQKEWLEVERERAFRELKVINEMGFSHYFLVAARVADFCRQNGIYFHLRGSGGASFILFLLGISRLNPLHYDLLFERFVNRLRDDLPDIDIDIDSSRRHQVLKWVFDTYGSRVAFISTHKFFGARSAIYEVARAHGFSPEEAHRLSKQESMFATPAELRDKGNCQARLLYNQASLLDGVYRELSLHLGGVVFDYQPIEKSFPMAISPDGFTQVVWDKTTIERLKIFKLDLLGVRGFDVIAPVAGDNKIDFHSQPVWENIRHGRTIGCFQIESPLARENLIKVLPGNLSELAVAIAIIRPGPARSGMKKKYLDGEAPLHPLLGNLFPHSRGTIIFEEQISVLLHHLTGWSLEKAEKIRRDLKKKKGDGYGQEFFHLGRQNGWKDEELRCFWQLAVDFSHYAFNHAHSISYSYSAYISAWFKTHHPRDFFCRLFNAGGGYYALPFYIQEAQRWGIKIEPPDINLSHTGFSVDEAGIRTGLIFVKGIGHKMSSRIVDRRNGGYHSVGDFIDRVGPGDRELSALLAVSAFQSVGFNGHPQAKRGKHCRQYLGFVPDFDI